MCTRDLPGMYALSSRASIIHIRQISCALITTTYYMYNGLYVISYAIAELYMLAIFNANRYVLAKIKINPTSKHFDVYYHMVDWENIDEFDF